MALEPVVPRPAATVVPLRRGRDGLEALLTHRPSTMAFAPGMHVFPGGRVDTGDVDPGLAARSVISTAEAAARLGGDLAPAAALAAHVAAVRELWEESGILLADSPAEPAALRRGRERLLADAGAFAALAAELELRLRTDLLAPLSRWVTPPESPRRFDARFFAAIVPADAAPTLLGDEVVALDWWTPRAALDAMAAGTIGLWVPTSATLQQLEHATSPDDLAALGPGPLGPMVVDEPAPGIVRVVMPAGGGVAGQPVCAYLVGERRIVLVDPGDPTGPALERCFELAGERGGRIVAVALTHADPDHHAGAQAVAERVDVSILAGPGGGRPLPYAVRELSDGEVIDAGDVPLRAVVTPGPRPEHLTFVVGDGRAVLTGDLDGRRGARSLFGPADADAWERSRTRLAGMSPDAPRLGGHPGD